MRSLAALFVLCLLGLPAYADILYLEGGGKVEGVVTETDSSYTVKGLTTTVVLPKGKVVSRLRVPYVTELYEQRRKRADPSNPDALYRLSEWCERNGLRKEAERHRAEVLALDPDHAGVRARRGEVKHGDAWVTPAEARDAEMAKAGFVRFEDRWFTEEGLRVYLETKKEAAELEARAEERKAEREARERKARAEEERLRMEAAERKAIEAAIARAEEDRRERERLARENERLRALVDELLREDWTYRRSFAWIYGGYPWSVGIGAGRYGHPLELRHPRSGLRILGDGHHRRGGAR